LPLKRRRFTAKSLLPFAHLSRIFGGGWIGRRLGMESAMQRLRFLDARTTYTAQLVEQIRARSRLGVIKGSPPFFQREL
jgi:hypothetical protein